MTNHAIDNYVPPPDVVALKPNSLDFFYAAPHGEEIIGMMLHTDDLGAFAVLFTPEAAFKVSTCLANMAEADIDLLRAEHKARHGGDE